MRILNPTLTKTPFQDFFPNVDLMLQVRCPVFILHGTAD